MADTAAMTDFLGTSARIRTAEELHADAPDSALKSAFRDGVKAGLKSTSTMDFYEPPPVMAAYGRGYGVGQRARAARGIKTMGDE